MTLKTDCIEKKGQYVEITEDFTENGGSAIIINCAKNNGTHEEDLISIAIGLDEAIMLGKHISTMAKQALKAEKYEDKKEMRDRKKYILEQKHGKIY